MSRIVDEPYLTYSAYMKTARNREWIVKLLKKLQEGRGWSRK